MSSTLKLLLGDAGSGKTTRLLAEYRAALRKQRERRLPGRVLWLAPTHRAAQAIVAKLLSPEASIQFAPQVITFDVFAEQILASAGQPATPISPVMKRLLIRRIVTDLREQGKLASFASVSQTSGFLDVVSSFISELKREEIWPEDFLLACADRPPRLARRDSELGLIYERYQHHLSSENWYDTEGRFWLARNALNEGVRGRFASVEFFAVDGFADFTRTQYEILGKLLGWIRETVITLPSEQPSTGLDRPELFAKPRQAIDLIKAHLPNKTNCQIEHLVSDRSHMPAGLRTISEFVFSNPRTLRAAEKSDGLEVIAATGPEGERRAIARRIKLLLRAGIAPSQIVVAMRTVSESGSTWNDFFVEAGIPTWCEAGTPLNTSPIVKALFSVLQLELENWPFPRLMQVLDSNYFHPNWPDALDGRGQRAVSATLRKLKLHSGRDLILRVLAKKGTGPFFDPARELLTRLSSATDRLRRRHTLTDWGDVISSLGEELGWRQSVAKDKTSTDNRDWELLQGIIRTAAEADRRFQASRRMLDSNSDANAGQSPTRAAREPRLNLEEFTAELRDLLRSEQIKPPADVGGCVRILDVEQTRHLEIPYLFVVGLAESSFPQYRGDDCLFGETERQEFARRGLNLKHRQQHQRDEMFLFYSVVTRGRDRLTLSYPAVNSTGQPVFPSPYVAAIRSLFSSNGLVVPHEGQLDPVPSLDGTLTETDLRLASITEARAGRAGLFVRLGERREWIATARNVLSAIEMNQHRFHERGFTSYEGRLSTDFNIARLQQRYGARHQFSATELESFATCPYRYWVSNVIGVEELDAAEQGTDHAARGRLIHDVLGQLLREGIDKPAEALAARFRELVEAKLSTRVHETDLQRAMTRIEKRLLFEIGNAFAEQQVQYQEKLHQVWSGAISSLPPEIPFGKLPDVEEVDEVVRSPLTFGTVSDGVKVRGRIDRVDAGSYRGEKIFNVIDYKTGNPPKSTEKELHTGRAIQLALYAMAVRRLGLAGAGANPFSIGYWSLRTTGFIRGYQRNSETFVPLVPEQFDALEQILESVIPQLVSGIRSGKFLVENADDNCTGHCPYHTTCRVNQIRPLADRLHKVGDILAQPSEFSERGT